VGHPLDMVKVRMQTQPNPPIYTGMIDCFKKSIQSEGILGVYRGAQSPLINSALYSSILFLSFGFSKRMLTDSDGELSLNNLVFCGAFTGAMAASVESPMDLMKSKMQVQKVPGLDAVYYKSSIDVGVKIFKEYGVRGMYQGCGATLYRNVPGSIVYFTYYESMRAYQKENWKNVSETTNILFAGGTGGVLFWLAIYPFDVARTKLLTDHLDRKKRVYKGTIDCLIKLYRAEGSRGLFRGLTPCLVRAIPTNGISFLTFEYVRKMLG